MIKSERLVVNKKVDPAYGLCRGIQAFFPIVDDYTRICIKVKTIKKVDILIQQALDPNQDVYIQFKIIEMNIPVSLSLLVLFLSMTTFIIRIAVLAQREENENI